MEFDRRYKQLNLAQKEAVDTIDGPVLVVAGPGTGKTELLSTRVANILKQTDTLPENILCLTFTESGATAMRERLVGIIGKDAYKVAIHTFHGFGTEIISRYREYFYNGALFEPADELAQYEILRSIFDELDYKNPLSSTMNGEFTHLRDAQMVISELKRSGGLTSDELLAVIQQDEASLDAAERILMPLLDKTMSVKVAAEITAILDELRELAEATPHLYEVTPLVSVLVRSLETALTETAELGKAKPLSAWKSAWTKPDKSKQRIFKSRTYLEKLKALSFVYNQYLRRMEEANLYDYDDMILQVVHAMEVHDDLRFALQEQYLYIMVDEFQDTNLAQLRILHNLTDNPVNEGAPNILAVGDDDQAIYGFQGADVSNILTFTDRYPSTKLVVLTDNYRSGEAILTSSRAVIAQGSDRLENRLENISKQLTAHRPDKGNVLLMELASSSAERTWIVEHIKHQSIDGERPSIAVLARQHSDIIALLPYFQHAGIPVRYERQDNALEQPPIVALELLARVVVALSNNNHGLVNGLLPELLAHPAWGITPTDLWKLSLNAYESQQQWLSVMETTPRFVDIHAWLVTLAVEAKTAPMEAMIDRLIGRDEGAVSPFFEYFFGHTKLEEAPTVYLEYLSALRAIRTKLHDYKTFQQPLLSSFVEFVDLYRRLGLSVTTPQLSRGNDTWAVDLLTAHKAKGLEFDHVYVIDAVDSSWGQTVRHRSRSIGYPENLPLAPAGNTPDERLRLFYVAMTRAKQQLTLTYSAVNDKERRMLPADFLTATQLEATDAGEQNVEELTTQAETAWYEPLVTTTQGLDEALKPRLETYRLSATHFTTFLDVVRGGPQTFLLYRMLGFPQAPSSFVAYGNAVHRALQQAHVHFVANNERRPLEDTLHDFEIALKRERLSEKDYEEALKKGSEQLPTFLASSAVSFLSTQKAELPFANQEVQLGDARLTGKIDLANINTKERTIDVTDYKTSKPILDWKGRDDHEKVNLHHHEQQLQFYKLLLNGSRDYHDYDVPAGHIAFVRPTNKDEVITLDLPFDDAAIERLSKLVEAVWRHIMALDFPDTSGYESTLKGIKAFEDDLIDGKI